MPNPESRPVRSEDKAADFCPQGQWHLGNPIPEQHLITLASVM